MLQSGDISGVDRRDVGIGYRVICIVRHKAYLNVGELWQGELVVHTVPTKPADKTSLNTSSHRMPPI